VLQVELTSSNRALSADFQKASKLMQERVLHTQGVMGLEEDLSPTQLVLSNADLSQDDIACVGAATRQAAADIEAMQDVLQQVSGSLEALPGGH
jgi:hypothetical protein